MALIKSISGIRGTIGGKPNDNLTPLDITKFAAAYGTWAVSKSGINKIIIGRDARISGKMISALVANTLMGLGINVIDLGLSTTPTVEMAVAAESAGGGIIITASHNPANWNALKLLNQFGEFISGDDGLDVLALAESDSLNFAPVDQLGTYTEDNTWLQKHVDAILALPLVDVKAIAARQFKVVVDAVNSTGGLAVPLLLKALGVDTVEVLFGTPDGNFPHNPEPLPQHLTAIADVLAKGGYDIGLVVDPDVDRLVFVNEDGSMFGEEYTLVAVADYILQHKVGNTVSNLSSTRALQDVTEKAGGKYYAAAVGEVNVVSQMKACNAVIGGEGNGGIIYPDLHFGRDALVGIALMLTYLAKKGGTVSALRASYPPYFISKNKIELTPNVDVDKVLASVAQHYKMHDINTIDGVKIGIGKEWVHLRKSNTEPIIRIYSEAPTMAAADILAHEVMTIIEGITKS